MTTTLLRHEPNGDGYYFCFSMDAYKLTDASLANRTTSPSALVASGLPITPLVWFIFPTL